MGDKKKEYQWRGLDLRTNKLYRQDGTASDIRNMTLTPSRELRKRVDMVTTVIPRGTDGETGEFLDKLPFGAEIIDIMVFDDYKVLATRLRREITVPSDGLKFFYINKFYKWLEETNTVEFIPFEAVTESDVTTIGQFQDSPDSAVGGRLTSYNQERVLYFSGEYTETDLTNTGNQVAFGYGIDTNAKENNLSFMYAYDGEVVKVSGVATNVAADVLTPAPVGDEEYIRFLPFQYDSKNRHTFGNYQTLKSTSINPATNLNEVTITDANDVEQIERHCYFQTIGPLNISEGGLAAANIRDTGQGVSVAKGQYLYSMKTEFVQTPDDIIAGVARISNELFRMKVLDVDVPMAIVTLGEFSRLLPDGRFSGDVPTLTLDAGAVLSNVIYAMYGSKDQTFGFEFRGLTTYGYFDADMDFDVYTNSGALEITYDNYFLFLNKGFEDTYDEETVKLPAPKVRSFSRYVGSFVVVDAEALYFSDFSLGGNIETFTPFDTFPVGSSEFGPLTGVFGNETFLAVFRQEETYYISGNIFTANYRIQSYKSTRIGCTDPRSIIDYRGAGVFASEKGLFVCSQGGAMNELSDIIEPLFSDDVLGLSLDMSNVVGMVDFLGERLLFSFENHLVEYNYYHKEWLLHDGIPMNGGAVISNRKIYTSDGTNVLEEGTTSTESSAYRRSNFETLGSPSLLKKFHRLLIFTPSMPDDFTVGINTYKNWKTDELITEVSKDGEAGQLDLEQRLDPRRVKSLAMEIVSESGQPFISEGYEYEYGGFSKDFQGDD